MKRIMMWPLIFGLFFSLKLNAQQTMDSISYSVGVLMAQSLKQQGLTKIDAADLAKGIEDVLSGNPLQIDVAKANQTVQTHMQAEKAKAFSKNKEVGETFLKENAGREGVVTLPSGLQYEVLKPGTGEQPKATDKVKVHYHGTLTDGAVFDSSVERGQPAEFGVTQVIQGWIEALQLMKEGAKWRIFIPYDLAYGERGQGPIGPYSTLIFEVELLEIL